VIIYRPSGVKSLLRLSLPFYPFLPIYHNGHMRGWHTSYALSQALGGGALGSVGRWRRRRRFVRRWCAGPNRAGESEISEQREHSGGGGEEGGE
jgi:hypothetical protein